MEIETQRLIKMKIQNKCMQLVIVMSSIVFAFATVLGSVGIGTVSAQQPETINASLVVPAPVDSVWSIVADVDRDPQYWSVYKEIKNLNKTSNIIERDATLNVNNANAHQILTLHPKDSVILNQTEGPITGIRTMTLSPSANNSSETKIDVSWNIDLSGVPLIGKGFAKDGIFKATEEALKKIGEAAK
jgi:hypothetical protein